MLCLIKGAVASREARRRRDSPAAAPAARFTLTCAFVVCLLHCYVLPVAACRMLLVVYRVSYHVYYGGPLSVVFCPLHVACCVVHVAFVVRCLVHVARCLLSVAILHVFCFL